MAETKTKRAKKTTNRFTKADPACKECLGSGLIEVIEGSGIEVPCECTDKRLRAS